MNNRKLPTMRPTQAGADDAEQVVRENDAMLRELGSATGRMREAADALNQEAREHNDIVGRLLRNVGNSSTTVRNTVQRVDAVMGRNGCSGITTLSLIVFFVLVAFYYLTKWALHARGSGAATDAPALPIVSAPPPVPPLATLTTLLRR